VLVELEGLISVDGSLDGAAVVGELDE
jgi:hypothetical protein